MSCSFRINFPSHAMRSATKRFCSFIYYDEILALFLGALCEKRTSPSTLPGRCSLFRSFALCTIFVCVFAIHGLGHFCRSHFGGSCLLDFTIYGIVFVCGMCICQKPRLDSLPRRSMVYRIGIGVGEQSVEQNGVE